MHQGRPAVRAPALIRIGAGGQQRGNGFRVTGAGRADDWVVGLQMAAGQEGDKREGSEEPQAKNLHLSPS